MESNNQEVVNKERTYRDIERQETEMVDVGRDRMNNVQVCRIHIRISGFLEAKLQVKFQAS
jgi:hypothetical protein